MTTFVLMRRRALRMARATRGGDVRLQLSASNSSKECLGTHSIANLDFKLITETTLHMPTMNIGAVVVV